MKNLFTFLFLILGFSAFAQYPPPSYYNRYTTTADTNFVNGDHMTNLTTAAVSAAVPGLVTNITVEQFGAVGDELEFFNASSTNGSPVITVPTASFVASDVGKSAFIYNDTTNFSYSLGKILSVNSPTQITLSLNALNNWTNAGTFVYGTDNTIAFSNALYWGGIQSGDVVIHADNNYLLCGPYAAAASGVNAQISLYQPVNTTRSTKSVTLTGSSPVTTMISTHMPYVRKGNTLYVIGNSVGNTNVFLLNQPPSLFGIIAYNFKNLLIQEPVGFGNPFLWSQYGGASTLSDCAWWGDMPTNYADAASLNPIYLSPSYAQDTNVWKHSVIVSPLPANNGGVYAYNCVFGTFPVAITIGEHSFSFHNWFFYHGSALVANNMGGTAWMSYGDYFSDCANVVSLLPRYSGLNETFMYVDSCGLELHGLSTNTVYDPTTNGLSGHIYTYGDSIVGRISPTLQIAYTTNSVYVTYNPSLGGNAFNATNLQFNNCFSIANLTFQFPGAATISRVGGSWHLYPTGQADFSDLEAINANSGTTPGLSLRVGNHIQNFQILNSAPTITDLSNSLSAKFWLNANNGRTFVSQSYDGTNVLTFPLGDLSTNTAAISSGNFIGNGTNLTGTSASITSSNASVTISPSIRSDGRTNYDLSASSSSGVTTNYAGVLNFSNVANQFVGLFTGSLAYSNVDGAVILRSLDSSHNLIWNESADEFRFSDAVVAPTFNGGAQGLSGTAPISITGTAAISTRSTNDDLGNKISTTYATSAYVNSHTNDPVSDARLSPNIPRLNTNNVFTGGTNTFNSIVATNLIALTNGFIPQQYINPTNSNPYFSSPVVITNVSTIYTNGNYRSIIQGALILTTTTVVPATGYVAFTNNGIGRIWPFNQPASLNNSYPTAIPIQLSTNATFQIVVTSGSVSATNLFLGIN